MPGATAVLAIDTATIWWVAAAGVAIAYVGFLVGWRDRTLGWVQFGLAAAAAVLLVGSGEGGWAYLGVAIGLMAVMSMAARQLAKTTMRVVVALAVLLGVLLVARVGTTAVEDRAYEEARTALPDDIEDLCLEGDSGLGCLDRVLAAKLADEEALEAATAAYVEDELIDDLAEVRARVRRAVGLGVLNATAGNAANIAETMQDAAYGPPPELVDVLATQEQILDSGSPPTFRARQDAVLAAIATVLTSVDAEAAKTAAAAAKTAKESAQDDLREVPALDLVTAGADQIAESWVEPVTGEDVDVPVALGTLAWLALLVAAVLGYRRLEWRNNQGYGAPVQVTDLKTSGDDLSAAYLTEGIKVRYGSTDLVEPPDTPGGSAFESVQTTLTEVGGENGKIAAAITKFAQATAFPKAGITVTGVVSWAEPDPKAAGATDKGETDGKGDKDEKDAEPKPVAGVFRLETSHEHRFIRTERLRADTPGQLMDEAAALIAGDVLSYSYWTPPWARSWGERGEALATYRRMLFDRPSDSDERIRDLRLALGAAPDNALVRLMLAHELDLAGQPVEALRLNLQNRIDHPHFLAGRYRLVTSLCMLSDPGTLRDHWWSSSNTEHRNEVLRLVESSGSLDRSAGYDGRRLWELRRWWRGSLPAGLKPRPDEMRTLITTYDPAVRAQARVSDALLRWAHYEADQIRAALRWWRLALWSVPMDERKASLRLLQDAPRRRREIEQIRSIVPIIECRLLGASLRSRMAKQPLDDRGRVRIEGLGADVESAAGPSSGTAARYNAACFWSVACDLLGGDMTDEPPQERSDREKREATLRGQWLDRSLTALEAALRSADGSRPALSWIEKDPDLANLRTAPGWRTVKARLEEESG